METQVKNPVITVIVVEDEVLIRMIAVQFLSDAGFSVLEAEDYPTAIAVLHGKAVPFHVLFTDVNIQGDLTGVHLAHHAHAHWPTMGVLIASGQPQPPEYDMPHGSRFIAKPYDLRQVAQHVRELAEAA
jgi:DNA-binding NtrC family response regulator